MEIDDLIIIFENNADSETAVMMKKYMKDRFDFLGIKKPLRSSLQKPFIDSNKKYNIDRIMITAKTLALIPYREYYYSGTDLLQVSINKMDITHMYEMTESTISIRPWWDSVDAINITIKKWFSTGNNSLYLDEFMKYSMNHKSMWANRISILCQLNMKDRLRTDLLEMAIDRFRDSDEFFLQKAIGWILREYSKYNAQYVQEYLSGNTLKPLSVREASKYI